MLLHGNLGIFWLLSPMEAVIASTEMGVCGEWEISEIMKNCSVNELGDRTRMLNLLHWD